MGASVAASASPGGAPDAAIRRNIQATDTRPSPGLFIRRRRRPRTSRRFREICSRRNLLNHSDRADALTQHQAPRSALVGQVVAGRLPTLRGAVSLRSKQTNTPMETPVRATVRTLGSPKLLATNPAIAGATPPPNISPAPTTMPIDAATNPAGADSVAMGPVIKATFPRQKKEVMNRATNSKVVSAPICENQYTETAAARKPMMASGLRPNLSESPG